MFYAGDEYASDEITSGCDDRESSVWEAYCDYCDEVGHTFRTCPVRDDDFREDI